jgi:accessory colonization factor AcfC
LDAGDMAVCVNAGPQEQWKDFAKKNTGAGAIIFLNRLLSLP